MKALDFKAIDQAIAGWMDRYGTRFLRLSLAVIFIWFGALKPLHLSPAQELGIEGHNDRAEGHQQGSHRRR